MDNLKLNNLYQHFLQCKSVSTDSRQIIPGSIFFALKGENFDGNLFAVEAIRSGAAMAVVDDVSLHDHPGLFWVPDALESLKQLAMLHRRKMKARVIAITGSNGKTTTKELVYVVLKSVYQVIATQGNLNNQIGVPLTLLRILPETEFAVIEMGANHVGEIAALCSIASPGFGMITNIGKAHLEGFGGIEGVVRAKTELYKAIENIKGVLFVNQQDALLMQHSEGIIRATYGKQSSTSLINGQLLSSNPLLSIEWNETGSSYEVHTNLVGAYNLDNILAAITIGRYFDIQPERINQAIQDYIPSNNRSQLIQKKQNRIIMDAYNANPVSMTLALQNFATLNGDKRMLILGDMLELGKESEKEHQAILDLIRDLGFQEVYLVGQEFGKLMPQDGFLWYAGVDEFNSVVSQAGIAGYDILIKGSRGIRLERVSLLH